MAKEEKENKSTAVKPIKKKSSKSSSNETTKKVTTKTKKKNENEKKEVKKKEEIKKEEVKTEIVKEEDINQSNIKSALQLALIIAVIIVVLVFFKHSVAWNIIIVLLILSILIFVHEFGHYIIGKKCGVHIYEFALGMGPKVLGFKRKNDPTEYTIRAFPIGGFCQLAGEEGEDDDKLPKDKFMCNKSKLQRIAILVAGVTMNIIIAFILFFMISFIWGSNDQESVIARVFEDSSASAAGIEAGDRIIECNGYKISTWDKLTIVTMLKNESKTYEYKVEKEDGTIKTYKITPDEYITIDDKNIKLTEDYTKEDVIKEYNLDKDKVEVVSLIGIEGPSEVKKSFSNALEYAFQKIGSTVDTMLLIVVSLINGNLGLDSMSGPVGMYTVVEEVAVYGIANIIYLMAYLSVNLAVINILPFPAFDGGRVAFIALEVIMGRKLNPKVEALINNIGFFLILALMLYITFQDIIRLF